VATYRRVTPGYQSMVKTLDPNELDPTQGEPEGETVVIPGNEPEPEQEIETEAVAEQDAEGDEPEVAPEPTEEKPKPVEKPKLSWELRRINEETNKRREVERRLAEAEAKLAAQKPAKPAEEAEPGTVDVEQIRAQTRDQIRLEETARLQQERFNAACNATFANGKTDYGTEFDHAVETMSNALGDKIASRPEFLETVTDMENGHQVYFEMSRDPEEAERILSLPTSKMILELAKMSIKVAKPTAPKPISKAPAPVVPVGGNAAKSNRLDDESAPMDAWAQTYLKSIAGKG
jgi:hypothetical protein